MRQRVIIAQTDVHILVFFLFIYLFSRKRNGGIVSSDQNGGERRYRGTDRPHPARGQRRSTGATSRRFGERREQTAQPNTGIYLNDSTTTNDNNKKPKKKKNSRTNSPLLRIYLSHKKLGKS